MNDVGLKWYEEALKTASARMIPVLHEDFSERALTMISAVRAPVPAWSEIVEELRIADLLKTELDELNARNERILSLGAGNKSDEEIGRTIQRHLIERVVGKTAELKKSDLRIIELGMSYENA